MRLQFSGSLGRGQTREARSRFPCSIHPPLPKKLKGANAESIWEAKEQNSPSTCSMAKRSGRNWAAVSAQRDRPSSPAWPGAGPFPTSARRLAGPSGSPRQVPTYAWLAYAPARPSRAAICAGLQVPRNPLSTPLLRRSARTNPAGPSLILPLPLRSKRTPAASPFSALRRLRGQRGSADLRSPFESSRHSLSPAAGGPRVASRQSCWQRGSPG